MAEEEEDVTAEAIERVKSGEAEAVAATSEEADEGAEPAAIKPAIVPASKAEIRDLIYIVCGVQVMLDSDLAILYQVETKYLNRAAKRNEARFPEDFRFRITREEYEDLRCQIGTSSGGLRVLRRRQPAVHALRLFAGRCCHAGKHLAQRDRGASQCEHHARLR